MATRPSSLLLVILFILPVHSWTVFETSCTAPTDADHVNFVASSDTRSTLDIVWSALSVLVLCTWNAMHLSVPSHFDDFGKGMGAKLKEAWKGGKEKAIWMLVMVISPEYLFGKGMMEHFAARHSMNMFRDEERWTMTHAYFANMRGFVLRFKTKGPKRDLTPSKTGKASEEGLKVTKFSKNDEIPYEEQDLENAGRLDLEFCRATCHPLPSNYADQSADADEKSFEKSPGQVQELDVVTHKASQNCQDSLAGPQQHIAENNDKMPEHDEWEGTWALNAAQWHEAYMLGLTCQPPAVREEQIKDRSKGDGLAKGIAILQITWIVIQMIARAIEGLAITLLEVTVLAFASTAIAIYITIWDKPQDVKVPIFIDADRLLTRTDTIKLAARAPKSSMVVHEFWLHGVCIRGMADNVFPYAPGVPIPFTKGKDGHPKHHISAVALGMGLGGAIFGAIHCAAWNFSFPTPTEQLLWRISCIFIMASPMVCASYYLFTQQRAKWTGTSETWTRALLLPLVLLMPVYMLARFYLIVEACRALAYPSASTFKDVQWPGFIPHFG